MGGQDGIRGYLIQTLIGLLDALNNQKEWTAFTLEPDNATSKVDIVWMIGDQTRAVQVKSSKNQISVPNARAWANDLKQFVVADEHELVLIGPHSRALDKATLFYGVDVPPAKQLSVIDMVQQAAHNLDLYLDSINVSRTPPLVRELIVNGLVSRLTTWSTDGTPISREDFDDQLREWILAVYPESIVEAAKMSCAVLANNVAFWYQDGQLVLGLTSAEFVNIGRLGVIIDSVAIMVASPSERVAYRAAFTTDEILLFNEQIPGLSPFSGFHLPINGSLKTTMVFICQEPNYKGLWLKPNKYKLSVFLKYHDRDVWCDVHTLQFDINSEFIELIASGQSRFVQVLTPALVA